MYKRQIDCDATGEIYDDYTPSHITTQEEDLAARLERMSYIRDQYHLVIGSEGGNDFAASDIAYAHGIEMWIRDSLRRMVFYISHALLGPGNQHVGGQRDL